MPHPPTQTHIFFPFLNHLGTADDMMSHIPKSHMSGVYFLETRAFCYIPGNCHTVLCKPDSDFTSYPVISFIEKENPGSLSSNYLSHLFHDLGIFEERRPIILQTAPQTGLSGIFSCAETQGRHLGPVLCGTGRGGAVSPYQEARGADLVHSW